MANATTSKLCIDNTAPAAFGKNMFLSERYADFHFLFNEGIEQKRIPAHKVILTAASDVFTTMLNEQWNEENEVEIKEASFDVFKEFLQFLYVGKVERTIRKKIS